MKLQEIDEIQHALNHEGISVLYLYSDLCAPCQALRPKVEQLLREDFPKIQLLYADAQHAPELRAEFGVYALPAILGFADGKEFFRAGSGIGTQELREKLARPYSIYYDQ
jgi:thioredoxin-like negative regulator of GroEL